MAVDKAEITVIMDNYADWILENTKYVNRAMDSKNGKDMFLPGSAMNGGKYVNDVYALFIKEAVPLMAEHSLCLFISIYNENNTL